jgi:hypothetical protein
MSGSQLILSRFSAGRPTAAHTVGAWLSAQALRCALQMRSPSLDALLYIDLLEAYGNSRFVGQLCYLSQSNVYRAAMALSAELGFHLQKRDGTYRCQANQDVLANLREASRLLRARGLAPLRFLGDYRSPLLRAAPADGLWALPQTWLGQRRSLQLLDAGVLDVLLQRSSELLPILGLAPESLSVGQWTYTPRYALLPLNTETVQVYARPDHPLHGCAELSPEQLSAHPSPAFSDTVFPGLKERYAPHGLWSQRQRSTAMQPWFWETLALEGGMIVPSTPNAVCAATEADPGALRPLAYRTGLVDHDLLVLPIDLLDEPCLEAISDLIACEYHLSLPQSRRYSGVSHRLLRSNRADSPW